MILYYLFLILSPFQDNPRFGANLFTVGFIPITPIKIVGLLLLVAALFAPRPGDAVKPLRSYVPFFYAAFVAYPLFWTLMLHSYMPIGSLSMFFSYLGLLVATRFLILTRVRLRNVLRAAVFAETFGSLWFFKQFFFLHWARPIGPSSDPNYEALSLVMAIPLAAWLAFYDDSARWRTFGKAAAAMLAFAVIISQSRGGTLALSIVVFFGWIHSRHKVRTLLALALGAALLVAIAPGSALQRLSTFGLHVSSGGSEAERSATFSTEARLALLYAGLNAIRAHPIVGVGMDHFKAVSVKYNPDIGQPQLAHNTYVQLAAEGGIPALVMFLTMLALAIRNFRASEKMGKSADPALGEMAAAMRMSLFGYLVAAFFLTDQFARMLYLCVFLSQNIREMATEKMTEAETAGQPADEPSREARGNGRFHAVA